MKTTTKQVLCSALMLSASVVGICRAQQSSSAPYTYRGYTLGETSFHDFMIGLLPVPEKLKGIQNSPSCMNPQNGVRTCTMDLGFETNLVFVEDHLSNVDFFFNDSMYLEGFLKAITDKFGTPVETTKEYRTGVGDHVKGRVWTWGNERSGIMIEEYGHNLECGTVTFFDKPLLAKLTKLTEFKPEL